jgi:hypothetical protein
LNLGRYSDLGTFEARTLEGTTDTRRIKKYIDIMMRIKQIALQYGSISELIHDILNIPDLMFEVVFKEYRHNRELDIKRSVIKVNSLIPTGNSPERPMTFRVLRSAQKETKEYLPRLCTKAHLEKVFGSNWKNYVYKKDLEQLPDQSLDQSPDQNAELDHSMAEYMAARSLRSALFN